MKKLLKWCTSWCLGLLWSLSIAAQPALTRVEYYIDADPGYNNAISVDFAAGAKNLTDIMLNIDPLNISAGVHVLGIRAKNANDAWSQDNKWLFLKPAVTGAVTVPNLKRVEYYIDTDPGYGMATAISISNVTTLSDIGLNIDPATLTNGVHLLGIRAKDANGAWSFDNKWLFLKPTLTGSSTPSNLNLVEYYLDIDPGYGHATSVSIIPGINLSDIPLNLNPASISTGVHVLGIRSKNVNSSWSLDNKWLFIKPANSIAVAVPNLSRVEYYIDVDPGFGKAVPIAINSITGLADFSMPVNISGLIASNHKLFIRSKDENNAWSLDNIFSFTVTNAIANPSIIVNSVTRNVLCAKDTFAISYQANGAYNIGNQFNAELSDELGNFSAPIIIGSFSGIGNAIIQCVLPAHLPTGNLYKVRVTSTNLAVTGVTANTVFAITDALDTPGPIHGTAYNLCSGGTNIKYTIDPLAGAISYVWSVPPGCNITSGQGTVSIKITVPPNFNTGIISVVAIGNCSTGIPGKLNIFGKPGKLSKIKGLKTVSAGQSGIVYIVTATAGLNYTWTVPAGTIITSGQGSNSITVTWGLVAGDVTVKASNSCGNTSLKKLSVAISGTPLLLNKEVIINDGKIKLVVYPNPAYNECTLVFTLLKKGDYVVSITDVAGRNLLRKTGQAFAGENKVKLVIGDFSNGIYFINIFDEEHGWRSLKLTKQ